MPIASTIKKISPRDGSLERTTNPRATENTACSTETQTSSMRRSNDVSNPAADQREKQEWSELREHDEADVRGAVGEGERVAHEHCVLHPASDVRRERPEEHDAEHPVAQDVGGGARDERPVGVEERIFTVLARDVLTWRRHFAGCLPECIGERDTVDTERLGDGRMCDRPAVRVDAVPESRVEASRFGCPVHGELDQIRECRVRERVRRRVRHRAGNVADGVVDHVVVHVDRIGVGRLTDSLDATALIDGDVDENRTGSHRLDHVVGDERRVPVRRARARRR